MTLTKEKIIEDAYRYAIKNAYLHEGKATVGAVIAKIATLHKGINVKEIIPDISRAVNEVNGLGKEKIAEEYSRFEGSYELKAHEKEEGLAKLEWAGKEKVVTRYAPNPNGPFHLGNARAAILSAEYAKMYKGEFLLRFDDTDPKVKRPIENAEALFREDLKWLSYVPDKVFFASDRLEIYYKFMEKLIKQGKAYVCTCNTEEWRKKTSKGEACPCRELDSKEQMKRFEKMKKNEFREGEAVLRIKTDLKHKDPSVRDWWAAKIVDEPKHPNTKTKDMHVWPSYNFASAIDDHELGITLIIRGQEHEQNRTKQEFLYEYFGWKYPHCIHFGRIGLGDMILSTSKIEEGIENGTYTGWDDPRLGTIRALRRRGFDARALVKAIEEVGTRANDAKISIDKLSDLNKGFIDKESRRINFLGEPLALEIQHCPETEAKKDGQTIKLNEGSERVYIEKSAEIKKGAVIRLRNLYNVRITNVDPLQVFSEYAGDAKDKEIIVSWIKEPKDVQITMDDNSLLMGLAEETKAEKGDRFYLEKLGYCITDAVSGRKIEFYFSHK